MTRPITIAILAAVTLLLIVWDIYAATNKDKRDTISVVLLDFARRRPVLPFALGVIMGHLLWPQVVGP